MKRNDKKGEKGVQIEDIEVGERRVTKGAYQESEGVPKSTIGASLRPPNTNSRL